MWRFRPNRKEILEKDSAVASRKYESVRIGSIQTWPFKSHFRRKILKGFQSICQTRSNSIVFYLANQIQSLLDHKHGFQEF